LTPEQRAYLDEAVAAVEAADTFAFDIESTGFNPFADKMTGFSVAVDQWTDPLTGEVHKVEVPAQCVYDCCAGKMFPKAWYFQFVPELLDHLTYEQVEAKYANECFPVRATYKAFLPSFKDKKKKIVLHNGKFDFKFTTRANVPNHNILIDTAIAAWLNDENRMSQKLKDLVELFFGHKMVKFNELGQLFSPKIEVYGADDAAQTLRLWRHLEPLLEAEGLMKVFIESECRTARALSAMELKGAYIDADLITNMKTEVHTELDQVEQDIYRQAAEEWNKKAPEDRKVDTIEFNINSKPDVANLLFKRLGWRVYDWAKSEKTGKPSVAKKVLSKFENKKPLAKSLLRYSELYKIATGYTDPIVRAIRMDGRIRGRFNQIQSPKGGGGTVTGRLSASKDDDLGGVNLQTIPSRSDTGKRIRYMFIAPEGRVLICLDYSQIELRFLAHLSQDPLLIEAYCSWDCVDCGATGSTKERLFVCPECKAPEGHHKFEKGCEICTEGKAKTGCPKHGFKQGKDVHQLTADQVGCARKDAKCFHPDTEVLTRKGWVKIPNLEPGQEVVQAVPQGHGDVFLEWVVPTDVWTEHHPSKKLIHLKSEGIDLRVTPDHRMLVHTGKGFKDFLAKDFPGYGKFPSAGLLDGPDWGPEDWLLRLAVATQADGSYSGGAIRFTFTKRRKADRLRSLLTGVEHTSSVGKTNGKTSYTFRIPKASAEAVTGHLDGKSLPWAWLDLSVSSREVVLDEARFWDGHKNEKWTMYRYSNCDTQSVDVLQALAACTNRKTRDVVVPQPGARRDLHNLSVKQSAATQCRGVKSEELDYTDKVACLTVDSSYVLVRDKGIPLICGQTINFAVVYGTGPGTLAEQIGATFSEAVSFLENYFKKYKGVERFAESICSDLSRRGYVTTILKRRRRIPQARRRRITRKDRAWRSAMSARVQGSAADLMKVAIRNVHERLEREGLDAFLILTVHDELTVECAEEIKEKVYKIVQEEMENCFPLRVPTVAEGSWSKSWGEAK